MPESLDQEIRTLQTIFWSERDPDGLTFAPLADAFRRKGQIREALDLLTDGMSRHPDYATGHVIATRLYLDQGMHSEAELAARRVLELDRENLVALSALATVHAERGEPEKAAVYRESLLSVDPDSKEAHAVVEGDAGLAVEVEGEGEDRVEGEGEDRVEVEVEDQVEVEAEVEVEVDDSPLDGLTLASDTLDLGTGLDLDPGLSLEANRDDDEGGRAVETPGGPEPESGFGPEPGADPLPGPEVELPDLDALATDMPIEEAAEPMDFGGFALDTPSEAAAADTPDEGTEEETGEIVELSELAPDEPAEDVVELADLAPDEAREEVVDLSALAPDEPAEEVVELADLAPDEPTEEVVDLAALAPDEPAGNVLELADLAPDEPTEEVVDLPALAPDEASPNVMNAHAEPTDPGPDEEEDAASGEPVYTRTLAELYVKQGFREKALEVLRYLRERDPGATDLAERIEALERGEDVEASLGGPFGARGRAREAGYEAPPPSAGTGHSEEDVETRARDLAEGGDAGDDVDTPFAWDESADDPVSGDDADDGDIGSYFESLLEWETRTES